MIQSAKRYKSSCELCRFSYGKDPVQRIFESEFFLIIKVSPEDFMLVYKYHGRLPRPGERDRQAIRDIFMKRCNPENLTQWHVDMNMEESTFHWHAFFRKKQ